MDSECLNVEPLGTPLSYTWASILLLHLYYNRGQNRSTTSLTEVSQTPERR